jgi:uncharacterized protein YhjY with autotransporter beta-barrel domain
MKNKLRKTGISLAVAIAHWIGTAHAQSLDEQYTLFLGAKCDNMNFERDVDAILLPGQAGSTLKAYCDGPAPVGGILGSASNGGISGAGTLSQDDSTARRRREAAQNTSPDAPGELSVTRGSTSAFLSLRYAHEKQDTTRFEAGRDTSSVSATLGVDYRIGSEGLIGAALRLDDASGDLASGGTYDSQAHGFVAFASFFPAERAFVDFGISRNFRTDETHRTAVFYRTITDPQSGSVSRSIDIPAATLDSENDSRDFRAQLQAGYDFSVGSFSVGPRLGGASVRTQLGSYRESGPTPMALIFDAQRESSLRSALGAQASKAFTPAVGVFVLQANVDWLHEFEDDQRVSTARLAEDLRPNPTVLAFMNEAPDRNFYTARLSLSAVMRNGWAGFASIEGLLGHTYQGSVGIAVGLRKEL